jgi:hypothetical protein
VRPIHKASFTITNHRKLMESAVVRQTTRSQEVERPPCLPPVLFPFSAAAEDHHGLCLCPNWDFLPDVYQVHPTFHDPYLLRESMAEYVYELAHSHQVDDRLVSYNLVMLAVFEIWWKRPSDGWSSTRETALCLFAQVYLSSLQYQLVEPSQSQGPERRWHPFLDIYDVVQIV